MKKKLLSLAAIAFISTSVLKAQTTDTTTNKREIRIEKRLNDGKPEKTVIVIDNGKITVNGEEVKDLNGKLDMLGKGNFNFDLNNMQFGPEMQQMFKNFGPRMQGLQNLKDNLRNLQNTRSNKAMLGVKVDDNAKGARVTEVVKESSAEKAGLKTDDIITSINSDKIADGDALIQTIGKYKPEEVVDITVLRSGKEKKFKATLGKNEMVLNRNFNFNSDDITPPLPPLPPKVFNFNRDDFNGFGTYADRPKFGFDIKDNEDGDGAVITEVKDETNASKAGLKEADVVTEAAGTAIKNVDDLKRVLAENRDKSEISIKVLRSGKTQNLTLKVPKKIKTAEL